MGEGGHAADQGGCHRRYSVSTFNRDISRLVERPHFLPQFLHFLQTIVTSYTDIWGNVKNIFITNIFTQNAH